MYGVPYIINSDQGTQFTIADYKTTLKNLCIRQSMDGKSRWADNIMIERWFRSLKTELIYINELVSPRALRSAIREYISVFNRDRLHAAIDYHTPNEYFCGAFNNAAEAAAWLKPFTKI